VVKEIHRPILSWERGTLSVAEKRADESEIKGEKSHIPSLFPPNLGKMWLWKGAYLIRNAVWLVADPGG
jgi:hypothetical protein